MLPRGQSTSEIGSTLTPRKHSDPFLQNARCRKAESIRRASARSATNSSARSRTRLNLGRFLHAEPIVGGLFGQNVFVTTTAGEFVLRGAPHWVNGAPQRSLAVHERSVFRATAARTHRCRGAVADAARRTIGHFRLAVSGDAADARVVFQRADHRRCIELRRTQRRRSRARGRPRRAAAVDVAVRGRLRSRRHVVSVSARQHPARHRRNTMVRGERPQKRRLHRRGRSMDRFRGRTRARVECVAAERLRARRLQAQQSDGHAQGREVGRQRRVRPARVAFRRRRVRPRAPGMQLSGYRRGAGAARSSKPICAAPAKTRASANGCRSTSRRSASNCGSTSRGPTRWPTGRRGARFAASRSGTSTASSTCCSAGAATPSSTGIHAAVPGS